MSLIDLIVEIIRLIILEYCKNKRIKGSGSLITAFFFAIIIDIFFT